MVGKCIYQVSPLRGRNKRLITLASKTAVKIDECVQVDPQLISQRLSLMAMNEDPASFFNELCTHPAALFDHSSLPWQANKAPALVDALWKLVKNENEILPNPGHYVLDGGSLLASTPGPLTFVSSWFAMTTWGRIEVEPVVL